MKQNVFIALGVIATLIAGYTILSHRGSQKEILPKPTELKDLYNQWKVEHNVKVGSAEDDLRFKVFSANHEIVQKHNQDPKSTSKLGLNAFAHLTADEFAALHFGLVSPKIQAAATIDVDSEPSVESLADLPAEWDWETKGKVTKVMNQGQCGSSGQIPAVDAVSSLKAINGGELLDLSYQQVLDCAAADPYQSYGCNGAFPSGVLAYIRDVGLVGAVDYPYTATDGHCAIPASATRTKINGLVNVTANSAAALKAAVYKNPVAGGVDASGSAFQLYQSGVITYDQCTENAGHGVLIVGYGATSDTPYWRVKNLWGPEWGENGYFRLQRLDGKGACGINNELNVYPTD